LLPWWRRISHWWERAAPARNLDKKNRDHRTGTSRFEKTDRRSGEPSETNKEIANVSEGTIYSDRKEKQ
jgi:hypothetical protein